MHHAIFEHVWPKLYGVWDICVLCVHNWYSKQYISCLAQVVWCLRHICVLCVCACVITTATCIMSMSDLAQVVWCLRHIVSDVWVITNTACTMSMSGQKCMVCETCVCCVCFNSNGLQYEHVCMAQIVWCLRHLCVLQHAIWACLAQIGYCLRHSVCDVCVNSWSIQYEHDYPKLYGVWDICVWCVC